MNDLAHAVAFLESLGLAHGDRLKLADFDCTESVGSDFEACMILYGRLLRKGEAYLDSRTPPVS